MAQVTEEEFQAKFEEVIGDLGVAIYSIVRPGADPEPVRSSWRTFGRGLAVLIEMQPPS